MSGRRIALEQSAFLLALVGVACVPAGEERPAPSSLGVVAPASQGYSPASEPEALGGFGGMGGGESSLESAKDLACGDGVWDLWEQCDPGSDEQETCEELGFASGMTKCSDECTLDVSGCAFGENGGSLECGDQFKDVGEECDDGNLISGDGCSASCEVESSEHEPNNSEEQAEECRSGESFFGHLDEGDEDWLWFDVEEESDLKATVSDVHLLGCSESTPGMNPGLELLDSFGDPVAWDSDSGPGECAELEVEELARGRYYLRVVGEMSGAFPYVLDVSLD